MTPPRRHPARLVAVAVAAAVLVSFAAAGAAPAGAAEPDWRSLVQRSAAHLREGRLDDAAADLAALRSHAAALDPAARRAVQPYLAYHDGLLAARRADLDRAEKAFEETIAAASSDGAIRPAAMANLAEVRLHQAAPLLQATGERSRELARLLDVPPASLSPQDAQALERLVAEADDTEAAFARILDRCAASMDASRAAWAEPAFADDTRRRYEHALLLRRETEEAAAAWREMIEEARSRMTPQEDGSSAPQEQSGEGEPSDDGSESSSPERRQGDAPPSQEDAASEERPGEPPGQQDAEGDASPRDEQEGEEPRDGAPQPPTPSPGGEQQPSTAPPPDLEDDIEPIAQQPDLPDDAGSPAPTPEPTPPPDGTPPPGTTSIGEQQDDADLAEDADATAASPSEAPTGTVAEAPPAEERIVFGMTEEDARRVLETFDDSGEAKYRLRFLRSHRMGNPSPRGAAPATGAQETKAW